MKDQTSNPPTLRKARRFGHPEIQNRLKGWATRPKMLENSKEQIMSLKKTFRGNGDDHTTRREGLRLPSTLFRVDFLR